MTFYNLCNAYTKILPSTKTLLQRQVPEQMLNGTKIDSNMRIAKSMVIFTQWSCGMTVRDLQMRFIDSNQSIDSDMRIASDAVPTAIASVSVCLLLLQCIYSVLTSKQKKNEQFERSQCVVIKHDRFIHDRCLPKYTR